VLVVVGVLTTACAADDADDRRATVEADQVWLAPDEFTLTIGVHCHESSRAAVDQEEDAIFVHWELLGESQGDCYAVEEIVLDEPLGDRDVRYWFGGFLQADVVKFDAATTDPGCTPDASFDGRDDILRSDWHALSISDARVDLDGDMIEVGSHCHDEARVRIVDPRAERFTIALEVLGHWNGDCADAVATYNVGTRLEDGQPIYDAVT